MNTLMSSEKRTLWVEYREIWLFLWNLTSSRFLLSWLFQEEQRTIRKSNIEKFKALLRELGITMFTRWKEAQQLYQSHPTYTSDPVLQSMDALDFLATFEDYIKTLENEDAEVRRRAEAEKYRAERRNREAYWGLLQSLVEQGVLTTTTKWKTVYPLIKDDPRFLAMLGQPGSDPLEMFWDIEGDMEERFRNEKKLVTDIMRVCWQRSL